MVFPKQETTGRQGFAELLLTDRKETCPDQDFKNQSNTKVWNHVPHAAARNFTVLRYVREIEMPGELVRETADSVRKPCADKIFIVVLPASEIRFTGVIAEDVQALKFTMLPPVLSLHPTFFVRRLEETLLVQGPQEVFQHHPQEVFRHRSGEVLRQVRVAEAPEEVPVREE